MKHSRKPPVGCATFDAVEGKVKLEEYLNLSMIIIGFTCQVSVFRFRVTEFSDLSILTPETRHPWPRPEVICAM
jgi:hypothetical protein